jgi:lysozyme family protein
MKLFRKSIAFDRHQSQPKQQNYQETLILEPILTPSGLVDGGEDNPDPIMIEGDLPDEIENEIDSEVETPSEEDLTPVEISNINEVEEEIPFITDLEELDVEDNSVKDNSETSEDNLAESNEETITEAESSSELSEDSETEITESTSNTESLSEVEENLIENKNETTSQPQETAEVSTVEEPLIEETISEVEETFTELKTQEESELEDTEPTAEDLSYKSTEEAEVDSNSETDIIEEIDLSPINFNFDSGIFTVGETGEIGIDYLFDGGKFSKGELAIFSLEGMEELDLSIEEFVKEAANRALSDSEFGHLVISDANEGAKFSGELGEKDFNQGEYLGIKTFDMHPGDQFAVMLVPNGKIQDVFDNPNLEGRNQPLFSLSTANPDDGFQLGQIADVTGDGNTFTFEDLRIDENSDRDYNDIIFQVRGASGEAIHLDEVINPNKDWRSSNLGQALIEYAQPYITPEEPIVEIENNLSNLLTELENLLDEEEFETDSQSNEEVSNSESIETEVIDEIAELSEEEEYQDESTELVESNELEVEESEVIEIENNLETSVVEESEALEIENNLETSVVEESEVIEIKDNLENPVVEESSSELEETEVEENLPTAVVEETEESEVIEIKDNLENPVREESSSELEETEVEENLPTAVVEETEESEVIEIEDSGDTPIVQQTENSETTQAEDNLETSIVQETEKPVVVETENNSESYTSQTKPIVVDNSSDNLNIEETEELEVVEITDNSDNSVVEETEASEVIEIIDNSEMSVIEEAEKSEVIENTDNSDMSVTEEAKNNLETPLAEESNPELEKIELQENTETLSTEETEQSDSIYFEDNLDNPDVEESKETELTDADNSSETSALPVETTEFDNAENNSSETSPTSTVESPTFNLVDRLENLTYNLKNQTLSETPVNSNLVQQLEQLTNRLILEGETSLNYNIPSRTLELIEQLETQLVVPTTVEPPIDFEFPTENQPLIGIIDTGFNGENPDLDYSRITWGSDQVDGDADPTLTAGEGNEHGTHILGLIAAKQDNGIGIDGINNNAPIWAGRAIGSGKWAESLVEFVDAAVESGQPNAVVNLSLDLTQTDAEGNVTTRYEFTPQERAAIEYARQHNVMIVVGAGNDGGVMSALGQASQEFDNIITVGAAERVNDAVANSKAYERANYSSYGYGLDVMASGGTTELPELSTSGDGVGTMAGTSVATAKVTGAISQVWAANPELSYRQVIEIVKDTAVDLGVSGWDTETGAGLLNIAAAVQLAKVTTSEEHITPPILNIDTWSGEGIFTPGDRAVNNNPPTITVHNRHAAPNEVIPAANFFSATDRDGNNILQYKFYSSDLMPGSGYFTLNGVKTSHSFTIDADQLQDLQFVSSSVSGKTQTFSIRAFDGKAWSPEVNAVVNPQNINGATQSNKPPNIITKNRDFKPGETVALSTLFSVNDADSNAMQIYHIYDRDHSENSGYITLNGVKQSGSIYVNASQLKDMNFVASGQTGKTETLSIRGFDGKHWSQYSNFVANPQPVTGSVDTNRVPIVSTNNITLAPGSTIAASSLFSVQDPDGDAMQSYYFHNRDSSSDGSYFTLNGVKQPRTIYVNANQLKDLKFVAGRNGVEQQSIVIAAFDGKHWSDDSVLSVNSPTSVISTEPSQPTPGASPQPIQTATSSTTSGNNPGQQSSFSSWQQTAKYNTLAGVPGQSRQYIVKSGDTLWSIAQRQLGNGNRWREIMKTPTGGTFTDAEAKKLRVGQSVYLPVSYQTGTGKPVNSGSTQPANFDKALAFVRRWEGGYVNHPNDPGGATNKGIIQNTYNAYRASKGLPAKDVRWITDAEVNDIYRTRYWTASGSDKLTSRLAMVHFDTAVNLGVGGASGLLQQARQSSSADEMSVVRRYLDLREARYRAIVANDPSQRVFLNGWLNRLNSLRTEVEAMGGNSSTPPSNNPTKPKPTPSSKSGVVNSKVGSYALNFRSGSFVGASTIGKLPKGTPIKILKSVTGGTYNPGNGSRNDWYQIEVNGKTGYVAAYYVDVKSSNNPKPTGFTLKPGATNLEFQRGQKWVTSTGYKFVFQTDGNLVLYTPQGKPIWATGTNGTNADRLSVQTDGNVVLYAGRGNPVWATNTAGNKGAYFAIQGDGNLVVYSSSGKAIFNTSTNGGRQRTLSASARWLRDRNLKRFPGLKFSTVVSKATGKALDAGGRNNSVYPHSSPNSKNEYHQWGFEKVGDYYMIINKATGKALDGGGDSGKLPYVHPDPTKSNSYQLWKLQKVGDYYMIINKATGKALDSGGANGNQIYMYPHPIPGNSFHQWKLNLPNNGGSSTDFTGKVMSVVSSLNVRSGPGIGYSKVGSYGSNTPLTFDAWTRGTSHWDPMAKQSDNRWFRIKGTNKWVASAYIYGNPKSNSKYIDPPGNSNSGGNTGGGTTNNTKLTQLLNGQLTGQYIDVDGYYGAQCWDLVAHVTGQRGLTTNWRRGANVMSNRNIQNGTAIATFLGPGGTYDHRVNGEYIQHTGIFAGYGTENGVHGFYIWDQNWGSPRSVKKHFISASGTTVNNANHYHVIQF